ncbi:hypothetical protein BX600DRAFT_505731 [Xylariales sp. PMI_506]|nr:hypothetical protein BX600DRAFT_505731 [Xylariales sp. PMI_506]
MSVRDSAAGPPCRRSKVASWFCLRHLSEYEGKPDRLTLPAAPNRLLYSTILRISVLDTPSRSDPSDEPARHAFNQSSRIAATQASESRIAAMAIAINKKPKPSAFALALRGVAQLIFAVVLLLIFVFAFLVQSGAVILPQWAIYWGNVDKDTRTEYAAALLVCTCVLFVLFFGVGLLQIMRENRR